MSGEGAPPPRTIPSGWQGSVLVCRKCSRKLDGGFGDRRRHSLAKALRRAVGVGKGRKAGFGVVEVKCLGVCPKGAVTVVDGARPDRWLLVPKGADVDALAAGLRATRPGGLRVVGE